MGPSLNKNTNADTRSEPWALPIATSILVVGSLAFWTLLAAIWLASRPQEAQPVVIFYMAHGSASQAADLNAGSVQSVDLAQGFPDGRTN